MAAENEKGKPASDVLSTLSTSNSNPLTQSTQTSPAQRHISPTRISLTSSLPSSSLRSPTRPRRLRMCSSSSRCTRRFKPAFAPSSSPLKKPTQDSASPHPRISPNPSDEINKLPYLDKVVRETLRLIPPGIVSVRSAEKDTIVPLGTPVRGRDGTMIDSVTIPKGTAVSIRKPLCYI